MHFYPPSALIDFAIPKWEAKSYVRIEDAYKWLFQATRGGEHLVLSRERATEALEREWAFVGNPSEGEPLWEPLSPDEKIGRLNIRPFKDLGGSVGGLATSFFASIMANRPGPENFLDAWTHLEQRLAISHSSRLTHPDWVQLNSEMKAKNYPAIHHSDAYRAARNPAYRVLTAIEAKRLLKDIAFSIH